MNELGDKFQTFDHGQDKLKTEVNAKLKEFSKDFEGCREATKRAEEIAEDNRREIMRIHKTQLSEELLNDLEKSMKHFNHLMKTHHHSNEDRLRRLISLESDMHQVKSMTAYLSAHKSPSTLEHHSQ